MNVYITVCDPAGRGISQVIGAFSTKEKARAAAQEIEDEDEGGGTQLSWKDTSAQADDGDTYDVVLAELDVRIG